MSKQRQRRPIPLRWRKIIFRLLIMSAFICIIACLAGCTPDMNWSDPSSVARLIPTLVPPFVILVRHTLCIWPRRYWLNICELLLLTIETGGMIVFKFFVISFTLDQYTASGAATFFAIASSDALAFCVAISLLFLLWNVVEARGKNLFGVYDILANYEPMNLAERRLTLIVGTYAFREQFEMDNPIIQLIRGWLASLFFIAVTMAALYALIAQPTQQISFTSTKSVLLLPTGIVDPPTPSLNVIALVKSPSGAPQLTSDQLPSFLNVTMLWENSVTSPRELFSNCSYGLEEVPAGERVTFSCKTSMETWAKFPPVTPLLPDLLISVDYKVLGANGTSSPSESINDRVVAVHLGLSDSTEDVITNSSPTPLLPGFHLYGFLSLSLRDRQKTKSPGAIVLGIPQSRRLFFVSTINPVVQDPSQLNPADNTTATLRIIRQDDPSEWKVDRDYIEQSMLDGIALIGGFWTFLNGTFATIFGSTLLFVLFGIKPLSIYGLIHIFRKPKNSSGQDTAISPEEQARILVLLKKHLLDVDDVRPPAPDSDSSSAILPQYNAPRASEDSEELMDGCRNKERDSVDEVERPLR